MCVHCLSLDVYSDALVGQETGFAKSRDYFIDLDGFDFFAGPIPNSLFSFF